MKRRSGQPPPPPQWSYAKVTQELEIWRRYSEAEEELEWVDLKKVNQLNSKDFIVETLKRPLHAREIYLKRPYLFEFDAISSMRASVPSPRQRTLAVTTMYDSESRGARVEI